ncbi:hypothetical protein Gotri_024322 [Gossypium trilobum]|uniref:Uncharacterized protein n=1 Tax=Gossypium trilobum TaxID=34281 RepID=A0A7J9DM07_9ROSI|nr:hypothetical protein [Gossypium trilobum]
MDVSATQSQPLKPNQDGSTSSNKKKKIYDGSEQISTSIIDVDMLLGENMRIVSLELNRSIAFKKDECYRALSKISDHSTQMLIFFSLPSSVQMECVRRFLFNY